VTIEAGVLAGLLASCAPQVAPVTLQAIIDVESQRNPFAIGVNSGATLERQPRNRAEAIATARGLLRRGASFDAGLMQVNSANFARLGLTPENMFDPCTNIRAGAAVLTDNYTRARDAGVARPLAAAISEYNTGSRTRGHSNGYVSRVHAAARIGGAPAAVQPAVSVSFGSRQGSATVSEVANILATAFNARITDTVRPMNASYGADRSYHKIGQAVDFVPRAGLNSITRAQIRAVLAARGIQIVELLGPGDPGHSDHWHVAFASSAGAPAFPPAPSPSVILASSSGAVDAADLGARSQGAVLLQASLVGDGEGVVAESANADPQPPRWDVFAYNSWLQRQNGRSAQ
jgi:hypothetical protein